MATTPIRRADREKFLEDLLEKSKFLSITNETGCGRGCGRSVLFFSF